MRPLGIGATACLLVHALAAPAAADRVAVKGTTLEGTVREITGKHVVMETVYGEGKLSIPIGDVESIETDGVFHVVYEDGRQVVGPVTGVSSGALEVAGPDGGASTAVPLAEVHTAVPEPDAEAGLLERMDVELPFWSGSFDLSFGATQATDDTLTLATGLGLERDQGPHHTRFKSSYQLGRQQKQGQPRETTVNQVYGVLRQQYDFTDRWFGFGSVDGEYDEIQSLSLRTVPRLGAGYKLYKSETATFSVDGGGGYVYERYFGGDTDQYPAVSFGAESDWKLPLDGARWHTRLDYTPSLEDFMGDYLLRGETWITMPLWEALSFKVSVLDTYDSTPADDNERNNLSTLVGLSYGF